MNVASILAKLRSERARIENAIAALESLKASQRRRFGAAGRIGARKGGGHALSAAGRRKLSQLMRERWAKGKIGKNASKPGQTANP